MSLAGLFSYINHNKSARFMPTCTGMTMRLNSHLGGGKAQKVKKNIIVFTYDKISKHRVQEALNKC